MKTLKSILLVEDDIDDQEFFVEVLRKIDNAILYDVANNGQEALDKLESVHNLPNLIFSDINMPVMDGIEWLTEMMKNPGIKKIPVVILTSDTRHVEVVRALGAKAFIKKANSSKKLLEQVEQMINLDFIVDSHIANQTFQTALRAY